MRDEYFWSVFGLAWIFGWAIIWMVQRHLRERTRLRLREMAHRERLAALERQVPLPELPDLGEMNGASARVDPKTQAVLLARLALGFGLLGLFVGAGICAAFLLSGDPSDRAAWSMGLIPAMGGFGLLLFWLLLTRTSHLGR